MSKLSNAPALGTKSYSRYKIKKSGKPKKYFPIPSIIWRPSRKKSTLEQNRENSGIFLTFTVWSCGTEGVAQWNFQSLGKKYIENRKHENCMTILTFSEIFLVWTKKFILFVSSLVTIYIVIKKIKWTFSFRLEKFPKKSKCS